MKLKIKSGTTSKIIRIFIQDALSTIGAGLTGLVYNSSGLTAYYSKTGSSSATSISLVTCTLGSFTSGGFKELDATNMPGVYELHIPDAALSSGAETVHIMLKGASNMVPVLIEVELDLINYQQSIPDGVWTANILSYPSGNTYGSGVTGLIQNIYYADIELIPDSANNQDEYGIQWFRNSIPLTSGEINNPAFSVYNGINGSSLLLNRVLSYAGSNLGMLSKIETTLTSSGVPYLIIASGTIDNAVRQWQNVVGKI